MPSLRQLRVFASLARHGNLGDTAQEVCLSKGAVSQSLGELERRLGTPLFDRVHPHLKINEQGRLLQPLAKEIVDRVENIRHLFDGGGAHVGHLKIGASQTIGNYLLPSLLARMQQTDIAVEIQNTYDLCEMVGHFELDLALIEGANHREDLVSSAWLDDEMLVVAAPHHPLAQAGPITPEHLAECDWIVREKHSGSREQFDTELAPLVAPKGRLLVLNALEAVLSAAENNLGLTFVSRLAVRQRLASGQLVKLDLGRRYTRRLSLVWHKKKFHNALMRSFIDQLRRLEMQE
ncbi:DNA-binding transcriptional regulator, LysR family [Cohaesibacter sp. ES.047]|uniref:LysR family transcriptional regulator n=1 Tax=Cohaesibacter sp. ES.047 TaxID=1798205 RepID=UPI000BB7C557|nr:LysR family transcriptional regulator [Cohaesibacter sp. ES.047]SNY92678.1 DNA-binding transcriptional regulator, LysR family [Cohaesibacter sp. ES.047]